MAEEEANPVEVTDAIKVQVPVTVDLTGEGLTNGAPRDAGAQARNRRSTPSKPPESRARTATHPSRLARPTGASGLHRLAASRAAADEACGPPARGFRSLDRAGIRPQPLRPGRPSLLFPGRRAGVQGSGTSAHDAEREHPGGS